LVLSPFLNIGMISACLSLVGKVPVVNELLMMLVRGSARYCMFRASREPGSSSIPQECLLRREWAAAKISLLLVGKRKNDFVGGEGRRHTD
jgi:hypothetical protein